MLLCVIERRVLREEGKGGRMLERRVLDRKVLEGVLERRVL